MSDILKTKFKWEYVDTTLPVLAQTLFHRIEYDVVTLEMTQAQYDLFADDTDAETLSANRFRPIDLTTNTCKPEWLFEGKLQLFIKIKD